MTNALKDNKDSIMMIRREKYKLNVVLSLTPEKLVIVIVLHRYCFLPEELKYNEVNSFQGKKIKLTGEKSKKW